MRPIYDVTLTYTKESPNGSEEVVETYKSILELARAYKTTNYAISEYMKGERKSNPLPEGYKMTLKVHPKLGYVKDGKRYWHCDACDIDVLVGNKTNHVNGVHHKQLTIEKSKSPLN